MKVEEITPTWDLISSEGYFQTISTLNSSTLEYACKSRAELYKILEEKARAEQYEICAIIRDEINKRN